MKSALSLFLFVAALAVCALAAPAAPASPAAPAALPLQLLFAGHQSNPGGIPSDQPGFWSPGIAYDAPSGLLFAAAGEGSICAYRVDGTRVARYPLPDAPAFERFDTMTHCGNGYLLVLAGGSRGERSRGVVYRIRIGAPDGTPAERVPGVENISGMSANAREGKVVLVRWRQPLLELDAATLAVRGLGPVPGGELADAFYVCSLLWGKTPEGADCLYWVYRHHRLHLFDRQPDGTLRERNDARYPASISTVERAMIEGDTLWYWNSGDTIARWSLRTLADTPGVVHGGASGHFLGKVRWNREMKLSGFCALGGGLYAAAAHHNNAVYILRWNAQTQKLDEIRRFGTVFEPEVLLLDRRGFLYADGLIWSFSDDALAPPRHTQPVARLAPAWKRKGRRDVAGVLRRDGSALILNAENRQCGFSYGALGQDMEWFGLQRKGEDLLREPPAAGSLLQPRADGGWDLLRVRPDGTAAVYPLNRAAEPLPEPAGEARFLLPDAVGTNAWPQRIRSVAALPDGGVLAVADGRLLRFARRPDGDFRRAATLAIPVAHDACIAVSGTRLCVTDPEQGALRVYDLASGTLLAERTGLAHPTRVAFNRDRICVYERGTGSPACGRLTKFLLSTVVSAP